MFSNTVLISCGDGFCKEPGLLIEGASKIALLPFCVEKKHNLVITHLFALKKRRMSKGKLTVKLALFVWWSCDSNIRCSSGEEKQDCLISRNFY